jgi:hypothetical protein
LDKKKHANILLIFVPISYTIELHPINVILQKPFKLAFKIHFNSWTFQTIRNWIADGQEPMVEFKMGNMKPKICGWLHEAGKNVKAMKSIIIKEWDKIGITKSFLPTF